MKMNAVNIQGNRKDDLLEDALSDPLFDFPRIKSPLEQAVDNVKTKVRNFFRDIFRNNALIAGLAFASYLFADYSGCGGSYDLQTHYEVCMKEITADPPEKKLKYIPVDYSKAVRDMFCGDLWDKKYINKINKCYMTT